MQFPFSCKIEQQKTMSPVAPQVPLANVDFKLKAPTTTLRAAIATTEVLILGNAEHNKNLTKSLIKVKE